MSDVRNFGTRQGTLSDNGGLGRVPPRVRVITGGLSEAEARAILALYDADITAAYTRFARAAELSGLEQFSRTFDHPAFRMVCHSNQGVQDIQIRLVTPQEQVGPESKDLTELNKDGFIWVYLYTYSGKQETLIEQRILTTTGSIQWISWYDPGYGYTVGPYFEPFVFRGTMAQANAYIAANYPAPSYIIGLPDTVYAVTDNAHIYFQYTYFVYVLNKTFSEIGEIRNVWDGSAYVDMRILKGSYTRLEPEDVGFDPYDPSSPFVPPDLPYPSGWNITSDTGPQELPLFQEREFERVIEQVPITITATLSTPATGERPEAVVASHTFTITEPNTEDSFVLKLGPTAVRDLPDGVDPKTLRGAVVPLTPPPPLPLGQAPFYQVFDHTEDPNSYQQQLTLVPYDDPIREYIDVPRDKLPDSGAYILRLEKVSTTPGLVYVYFYGEAFAHNKFRDVTSGWGLTQPRVPLPGQRLRVNDIPTEFQGWAYLGAEPQYANPAVNARPDAPAQKAATFTFTIAAGDVSAENGWQTWGPWQVAVTYEGTY